LRPAGRALDAETSRILGRMHHPGRRRVPQREARGLSEPANRMMQSAKDLGRALYVSAVQMLRSRVRNDAIALSNELGIRELIDVGPNPRLMFRGRGIECDRIGDPDCDRREI